MVISEITMIYTYHFNHSAYLYMPHILKNKYLEIHIDLPLENYHFSRFDWTGKISKVKFNNIPLSSVERTDSQNEQILGKGFYNEFGIDAALGFEEAEIGGWFHKIGVGLLKKTATEYGFSKNYEIQPAIFNLTAESNRLIIRCQSKIVNGYGYELKKIIELQDNSFSIHYYLKNTDAAVVYANVSTAFTDGGQFGMGAEIGISTQKLHARGPMALQELTSYKWIVRGDGQTREK